MQPFLAGRLSRGHMAQLTMFASCTLPPLAVSIEQLSYRYEATLALDKLDLEIATGEVFAVLGPNGGGKTTLFRLLSTLIPLQEGNASVFSANLRESPAAARAALGVVFQSASLDKKLTVAENMACQSALYGMSGTAARSREQELLAQLGVADRHRDLVETLSGGLRRRVELAKAMLHGPRLLLLDEPSTGLDPGARSDLWKYLFDLRERFGTTVLLTTHLLEEADRADRIAILNKGRLAALDSPNALRGEIGGDTITIESDAPAELCEQINNRLRLNATLLDETVRIEQADGHRLVATLVDAFPGQIRGIRLGKPSLEDVFIAKTGHRFWSEEQDHD